MADRERWLRISGTLKRCAPVNPLYFSTVTNLDRQSPKARRRRRRRRRETSNPARKKERKKERKKQVRGCETRACPVLHVRPATTPLASPGPQQRRPLCCASPSTQHIAFPHASFAAP
ncbi:hypothetical protein BU23DRAFT_193912 [Bimuria novae-zelandiae CBS 107.79]|uniref:Uncharacterized protein n=1 Tax=Bimuria novae-zelandiae CBS 107.79 TaxID=1447943 RepID=A0A6A5VR72_9PLEO|nr:hypothetical protein BU23DRAFT_193912 [Bimuria novae-zelandiae CBS 107.79]